MNCISVLVNNMESLILFACLIVFNQLIEKATCDSHSHIDNEIIAYLNRTTPMDRQMYDFVLEHKEPIGVMTTSSGLPVEIRDTTALNVNQFKNNYVLDVMSSAVRAQIPSRVFMAKGTGAWGYFEVNHDVSMYTFADVFNGIGKKTPAFVRFSTLNNIGGPDTERKNKGMSLKLYTREGNLDFVTFNAPFFIANDPTLMRTCMSALKRNPKTSLQFDLTRAWDLATKVPHVLNGAFYYASDYGIPNGYRKADFYPIHTYELRNKHGDRHFVRFNFRTCQGIENLSSLDARRLQVLDLDYYNRDLYDSIELKHYPAWDIEMYVMTYEEALHCHYNPFDVTSLWEVGTFRTVPIGRLVLNKNPENFFRDAELSAFNVGNLVPGIPGPIDALFRARRVFYRDAQAYRLGINHNNIHVNTPMYRKVYNRDGVSPVLDNMKDAPDYYPNSFSGPVPYVEESRPKDSLSLLQSKALDLGNIAYFYHHYVTSEMHKERFINNTIDWLILASPFMQKRALNLYSLVDPHLGERLAHSLLKAEQAPGFAPPNVLIPDKKRVL